MTVTENQSDKQKKEIEVHDNKVPFYIQQYVYNFVLNSNFRIRGWEDRDDMDKYDLHSMWSIQDLKKSKLYPYVEKFYSFKTFDKCVVNLTKPGDHYFTHTHGEGSTVVLYYVNLEWKDGWAGETIFYDHKRIPTNSYEYTPGRLLKFDGRLPHSIRPQSFLGPQYRFTISVFFKIKKE